jgi:hypothetical protein
MALTNTRVRHKPVMRQVKGTWEKTCVHCGEFFAVENFYLRVDGNLQSWCRFCMQSATRERYRKGKETRTRRRKSKAATVKKKASACCQNGNICVGKNGHFTQFCPLCAIAYLEGMVDPTAANEE